MFIYVFFFQTVFALEKSFNTIQELNIELTNILMKDQFSPPVASRVIAYSNLGALYGLNSKHYLFSELNSKIKSNSIQGSDTLSLLVFGMIANDLIWSQDKWTKEYLTIINKKYGVISPSLYIKAQKISRIILNYAAQDKYNLRLSYPRYSVESNIDSTWKLTPPSYKSPVEPYWGTLRKFLIRNSSQYIQTPTYNYSIDDNSGFMKDVLEVYSISKTLNEEQKETALYWDCNPLQAKINGHLTQFNYRLTPASHWILIASQILQKEQTDYKKSVEIYALLSISMADAFILCWEQKYKINRIRPVSIIQKHIDPNWQSFIQNPDFPEFPSGHSIVSATAAEILANYFGDNYSFVDNSQVQFGFKEKAFNSFILAAENAGISRLYGGIHYRDAIDKGLIEGKLIGEYIISKKKR